MNLFIKAIYIDKLDHMTSPSHMSKIEHEEIK